mgnify:CR=1 FL=1
MYQLRALIWKAYKLRLRSSLSTAIDVGGPIVIILAYIALKFFLGSFATLGIESSTPNLFRNVPDSASDPRRDLHLHLCTKVLFHSSSSPIDLSVRKSIGEKCGIELIDTGSRDILISKLRKSLDERVAFKQNGTDLNRLNATSSGCFTLPNSNEPSYQAGIVAKDGRVFEFHLTELVGNPVIHMPYTQGSSYNEFRLPQSALNTGLHLLQFCLLNSLRASQVQATNANQTNASATSGDFSLRVKAYPQTTSIFVFPTLFFVFQLMSNFCNAIATVTRTSEDNENGLHHYIRVSGVPSGIYWSSQMIITTCHMIVQNLVIAALLAVPANNSMFDPIQEINITFRYLLLLTYSLAINAHAMFVGSLFNKTSHALLVTCLLAIGYCMYPVTFDVQWNPYKFSKLSPVVDLTLFNPVSNYQALLLVIIGIYMETNEPISIGQLGMKIEGGGFSDLSIGSLWLLLLAQIVLWFVATILVDQFRYNSSYSPFGIAMAFANESLCFKNCLWPRDDEAQVQMKTKTPSAIGKGSNSIRDPNRLCCSLRQLSVSGPTLLLAHTRGNLLKIGPEQLERLRVEQRNAQKMHQYLVNRSQRPTSAQYRAAGQSDEPIILDDTIQQHIVWNKTKIVYENLSIDFRFNQVTFILGQTALKELLFSTLLGVRKIHAGHIVLDGVKYSPNSVSLARPYIGYLGKRDSFLQDLTIFENLQFFGSLRDPSYTQYSSESLFLLSLLHLTSRKNDFPDILTSRSARKLSLAAAAVGHTKLLLLVEPTLSLRWRSRCHVLNLLKKYKSIRSIIVDTSDIDEATAFGDRVVLLKNGHADLEGSPEHLSKRLACGHWLVFEPANENQAPSPENIKALEDLANEIFRHDKLEKLETTRRSVYEELLRDKSETKSSGIDSKVIDGKRKAEKFLKNTVILKVQQSQHSSQALCTVLKMFAQQKINGFRLAELTYESLEDVIVLRMSKAVYPDLPPDLLLSLQYRTQQNQQGQTQVSVRRCSSDFQAPKVAKSMYGSKLSSILIDRSRLSIEFLLIVAANLLALLSFGLALWALQIDLEATQIGNNTESIANWAAVKQTQSARNQAMQHSSIERLFRNRIGFYVIQQAGNVNSTNAYLNKWSGNKDLLGVVPRDLNESDLTYVESIIQKSRDLAASIVFFDPQTREITILFEPYLPHAMLAGIKSFINYQFNYNDLAVSRSFVQLDALTPYLSTSQHYFLQPWHEMVYGYLPRRFFYGIGFAFAEGLANGALVFAPVRHRAEVSSQALLPLVSYRQLRKHGAITRLSFLLISIILLLTWYSTHLTHAIDSYLLHLQKSRAVRVRTIYWLAMALFDLTTALLLNFGYIMLMIWIEGTYSASLLSKYRQQIGLNRLVHESVAF